jgi:hypothetical protein
MAHDRAMTNPNYGGYADRLDSLIDELELWQQDLTAGSSTPLPELYDQLASEDHGAVAQLLEELRESEVRGYRLTVHGDIPSSLPEEPRALLETLLAADSSGDLPPVFTYKQAKDLGGSHWREFRELLTANQAMRL